MMNGYHYTISRDYYDTIAQRLSKNRQPADAQSVIRYLNKLLGLNREIQTLDIQGNEVRTDERRRDKTMPSMRRNKART
jgi:hypothetical protein